jgi:hypothetical protein
MSKHITATGDRVLRAYNRAIEGAKTGSLIKSSVLVGLVEPEALLKSAGSRFQVFLELVRFSDNNQVSAL